MGIPMHNMLTVRPKKTTFQSILLDFKNKENECAEIAMTLLFVQHFDISGASLGRNSCIL